MCNIGIIGAIGNFLKTSIVLCCFLIICGPALIIVGSFLLQHNDEFNKFKQTVKDFDPTPINAWTGTINGAPIIIRTIPLNVNGVDGATSVFAEAAIRRPKDDGFFDIYVRIRNVIDFQRTLLSEYGNKSEYECTYLHCFYPGKKCNCLSKYAEYSRECISYKGKLSDDDRRCRLGKRCGTCKYRAYLSDVSLIVKQNGFGQYVEDSSLYGSFKYDFTYPGSNYQTVKPNNIVVRLYSEKDPFIALQRITEGTNQFQKEDHIIGIVLIIIGSVLLLLGMGVCTILSCYCVREKRKSANMPMELSSLPPAATNASAGAQATTEGPSMQQQNYVYGQPLSQQEAYSPREELPAEQQAHVFRQELPVEQKDKTQKQESLTNQERNTYGQRPLYVYGLSLPPSKEENDSDLVKK